ncbi:hypothetical protein BC835DRAFT_324276 [Cytidiella melzeri]|nr:hypothetical protein BC835DRAFT_324276 [Cytidiella melzeri]
MLFRLSTTAAHTAQPLRIKLGAIYSVGCSHAQLNSLTIRSPPRSFNALLLRSDGEQWPSLRAQNMVVIAEAIDVSPIVSLYSLGRDVERIDDALAGLDSQLLVSVRVICTGVSTCSLHLHLHCHLTSSASNIQRLRYILAQSKPHMIVVATR